MDMAHGAEVINLIGFCFLNDADQVGTVGEIPIMQMKMDILFMRILVEMIHAIGIKKRTPSLNAVNLVSLIEQELTEVSAILARYARNQCDFRHIYLFRNCVIFRSGFKYNVKNQGFRPLTRHASRSSRFARSRFLTEALLTPPVRIFTMIFGI